MCGYPVEPPSSEMQLGRPEHGAKVMPETEYRSEATERDG